MIRTATTLALALVLTAGMAQERTIEVRETAEMKASAGQNVELVEKTVGELNEQQQGAILDLYMELERHDDAMKQRYEGQPEEYEADIIAVNEALDRKVQERLANILDTEQLGKWQAALQDK